MLHCGVSGFSTRCPLKMMDHGRDGAARRRNICVGLCLSMVNVLGRSWRTLVNGSMVVVLVSFPFASSSCGNGSSRVVVVVMVAMVT